MRDGSLRMAIRHRELSAIRSGSVRKPGYRTFSSVGTLRADGSSVSNHLRKKSGVEVAAPGESGDAVGGAIGQGLNGHGGLATAGSDEAAAVAEKKILDVVGTVIRVDDRGFWIVAHAAGAEKVNGELLFVDG